ncbi:MAG: VWA domain-containing protein [Myxococcales bacterium]|nr:VWA domain-containing protein [Myxococcales bacterium]
MKRNTRLGLRLALAAAVCSLPFSAISCSASSDGSKVGANGGSSNGGSSNGGSAGDDFGGTTGIDANGGSGGGLPNGCAGDRYDGEPVPLDILIVLDRSGSMQDDGKWGAVTSSINSFLGGITGTGVSAGISFFPMNWKTDPKLPAGCAGGCGEYGPCLFNTCHFGGGQDSCVAADYTQPVVQIAPLPGNASQIQTAISGTTPNGNTTPVAPALAGALTYATAYADARPDHQVVVVLATDGDPSGCTNNSVSLAATYAETGNTNTPQVKTFVIGIGDLSALNQIAQKGGTNSAFIVSSGNAGQGFLDALNEIRGAVTCQYKIPVPAEGDPNPDKVNVGITQEGMEQEVIPQVSGPGACVGQPGWYYDNPSNPTQILLCPASCDIVEYSDSVVVDVVIGCDTVVR